MAVMNAEGLRDRFNSIISDRHNHGEFPQRLNEQGVVASVLIPLAEHWWGFDALEDIQYEIDSGAKYNRYDLLVDGRFLIEAKKMDVNINRLHQQIENYIISNDSVSYGVLTNGYQYIVYLQKDFIKSFLSGGDDIYIPIKRDVLPVMTISADDDYFERVIRLFSRDQYHYHFNRVAEYVLSLHNKGRVRKITDDRETNEYVKELIQQKVDVKEGVYLDGIKDKTFKAGDKLQFTGLGGNIVIRVILQDNGCVKRPKGSDGVQIKDMNEVMGSEFENLLELVMNEWKDRDGVYTDPMDIIREARGVTKLYNKEEYVFEKI